MNRAIAQGVGSAGGALLALGVGTLVLSNTCLAVGRTIGKRQRMKHAVDCTQCDGSGLVLCSVCRGDKVVDWSPFKDKPQVPRPSLCPTCGGSTQNKCVNCLGEGLVY